MSRLAPLPLLLLVIASPLAARESLGVYDGWAAFRDARPLRCYAIAKAEGAPRKADGAALPAYATVSTWPERRVRGSLHLVLSRAVADKAALRLDIGDKRFALIAKGRNAWAPGPREDAAIIAALRAGSRMRVSGGGFTDRYALAGAASAIDAATLGCARRG